MGGFSWVLEKARVKVNLEGYNGSLLRSSWVRLPNDGGRGRDARDCSTGFCLKGLVCVANWSLFGGCQAFSTCVVCLRMSFFWCGICVAPPLFLLQDICRVEYPLPHPQTTRFVKIHFFHILVVSHPSRRPVLSFISIDLSWDSFSCNCFPAGWAPVFSSFGARAIRETWSSSQSKQSCTR